MVVAKPYAHELADIKSVAPSVENVMIRGPDYDDWLGRQSNADPNPTISDHDFYVIRHSGGTTGSPKGMAFSHAAWMETERDWTYRLPPIEAGDACTPWRQYPTDPAICSYPFGTCVTRRRTHEEYGEDHVH